MASFSPLLYLSLIFYTKVFCLLEVRQFPTADSVDYEEDRVRSFNVLPIIIALLFYPRAPSSSPTLLLSGAVELNALIIKEL